MLSPRPFRLLATPLSLAIGFLILFVPLAAPLLTWRLFPSGDLVQFHLPMRFIYQQALRHGDTFLWSPALGSGLYLHAEGQTGMAHPLHLLLYSTLPLTAALNLEFLASYIAALAGTWLLFRRLGFGREAAFGGALMFAFCGFNLLHLTHVNAVAVVAHIPWLLWSADLILTGAASRARAAGFALTAATLGPEFLAGFPQAVWLSAVALAWFVTWRGALRAWPRIVLVGISLALGFAIGAVQWLPTLDAAAASLRAATTMAFRLSYSLHPLNLVQLVSPYALHARIYNPVPSEHFTHEFGVYDGAIATVALCWIAARWRGLTHRGHAAAFLWLAAAGLVLALGRYGGIYVILAHLPGISSLRGPTRHIALVHLAFAGLVAVALDDLLDGARERTGWRPLSVLFVPAALSAVVLGVAILAPDAGGLIGERLRLNGPGAALGGMALVLLTTVLFVLGGRGYRLAVPALILLTAIDLFWWGTRYVYAQGTTAMAGIVPAQGLPPGAHENDLVHPSAMRNDMNLYPMFGLRSSTAYLGLVPATVLDPNRPIAKRVAGVQWDWTATGWARLEGTMPRARLMAGWRVSTDVAADVEAVDVSRTALVAARPGETSGPPGTARVITDRPGTLVVETRAPGPQLLVLTERFHPGWRVQVDGGPGPSTLPVFGDYLACRVPAGPHVIALRFAPASARWGSWITIAGILATVAGTLLLSRRRSAAGPPPRAHPR